jgi:2'-5' RNA ligase
LRSFIAFKPPADIIQGIERLQNDLQSQGVAAHWVKPSNVHLTLKFLGDTDPAQTDAIRHGMQMAVAGQAPLKLALGGLGGFPRLSRPRVLWQAVTGEIERLAVIQQQLETQLTPYGFKPERRPYRAHLTLARIRHPQRWHPQSAAVVRNIPMARPQPFTLDTLVWYQSQLRSSGAEYTALMRVRLSRD